ncbi:MAG TPA: hypothetical protein VFT49_00900 [Candidatus Saccharimonadales bacterium]|nr:hypothetical protein [Candidatus Saccharimonadales bacterium]
MSFRRRRFDRRQADRQAEPVAAQLYLDNDYTFPVYEVQVIEANRILGKYIRAVTKMAEIADDIAEHSRLVGAKAPLMFNSLTIDILDEALLIVDSPIDYQSFTLNPADNKPVTVGAGTKPIGSLVRFDSICLSAAQDEDLLFVPQAEVIEYQAGSRPSVYNKLTFNPDEQRIALMDIDTPQIQIS